LAASLDNLSAIFMDGHAHACIYNAPISCT
jgi:hypothetical protein